MKPEIGKINASIIIDRYNITSILFPTCLAGTPVASHCTCAYAFTVIYIYWTLTITSLRVLTHYFTFKTQVRRSPSSFHRLNHRYLHIYKAFLTLLPCSLPTYIHTYLHSKKSGK